MEHVENINDKMLADIRRAQFVVADFTHHPNGVYFEAGFALGLAKLVIWTAGKTSSLPTECISTRDRTTTSSGKPRGNFGRSSLTGFEHSCRTQSRTERDGPKSGAESTSDNDSYPTLREAKVIHELCELAGALDELVSAMNEYATAPTPRTRRRAEKADRECTDRLAALIGPEAAFQFHASIQACTDVSERRERLLATLPSRSNMDPANARILQELEHEGEAALAAFGVAQTAMHAQLAEASKRHEQMTKATHRTKH